MNYPLRDRIAIFLERFSILDRVLWRYDGITPGGYKRYVNRINGHTVARGR